MEWQILGFEGQKRMFERAINDTALSHAYLFTGQDMIGKRTFAKELASKIADVHDMFELSSHSIEDARNAKNFLSLSPLNSEFKIVIVDNADRLTEEAQNALLKILEEPSGRAILFFVTANPSALLPTIASRCQHIFFAPHDRGVIMDFLKSQTLTDEQKEFLYAFSNGSTGLLARDFQKIKTYAEEYGKLAKADIHKRFDMAKNLATDEDLREKVLYWMLYVRSRKMYKFLPSLLALYKTVSHPQYNAQLALENFMLSLS